MKAEKNRDSRNKFESKKDCLIKDLEARKTNSWFMSINEESEILQRSVNYIKNNYGDPGQCFTDIGSKTDVAIRNIELTGRDLFNAFDFRYATYKKESSESGWYKQQAEASGKIFPEWNKMINILISHIRSIVQQQSNYER